MLLADSVLTASFSWFVSLDNVSTESVRYLREEAMSWFRLSSLSFRLSILSIIRCTWSEELRVDSASWKESEEDFAGGGGGGASWREAVLGRSCVLVD